jgi:hypothetical protein
MQAHSVHLPWYCGTDYTLTEKYQFKHHLNGVMLLGNQGDLT